MFLATPVMRTVERIEQPSTRQEMTRTRFSLDSLYILLLCLIAQALSREGYGKPAEKLRFQGLEVDRRDKMVPRMWNRWRVRPYHIIGPEDDDQLVWSWN